VSYRADGQQTIIQRYYPWGTIRPGPNNALPTDYTFTGQKLDESTGLMYYGARYYDPYLNRWIQPDTIIPDPANPQSLNRYSYVYNNPLRYIDPTGYLTEEQIMTHFGVETWEEVRAFFEEGGELEGRWGWLATLRTALLEDIIEVFSNYEGLWPPSGGILQGELVEREGQLYIHSEDRLIAANEVGWMGNAYGIRRGPSFLQYFGPYYAEKTYPTLYLDASKVDWAGALFDAGGLVADLVSIGAGGRGVNAAEIATTAGQLGTALDVTSVGLLSGPPVLIRLMEERKLSGREVVDLGLDVLGLYWPVVPDVISLCVNFGGAVYRGP
jgi:RHS repeat-associated protein